jgi:outer membrane protein
MRNNTIVKDVPMKANFNKFSSAALALQMRPPRPAQPPLETGIVQTVTVRDGQSTKAGAHLPTLDLTLNRAGNYNSGSLSSPADLSTRVNSQQIGVQLTVPLYAGGGTQSKVREALLLQDKARDDLLGAKRNASSQVRLAFAGVLNGQAQVEALQAAVEAGEQTVKVNKIGFKISTRINPDVLNAEQHLYSSMRDLMKARVEMLM